MTDDQAYAARRAAEELARAAASDDPTAVRAHRELARLYQLRADGRLPGLQAVRPVRAVRRAGNSAPSPQPPAGEGVEP